jgi:hypothetical protein
MNQTLRRCAHVYWPSTGPSANTSHMTGLSSEHILEHVMSKYVLYLVAALATAVAVPDGTAHAQPQCGKTCSAWQCIGPTTVRRQCTLTVRYRGTCRAVRTRTETQSAKFCSRGSLDIRRFPMPGPIVGPGPR